MNAGKVVRINGPIVRAVGLGGSGLYDVVEIGEKRLIGEIIRLEGDVATIQVYEDNTGMRVGERAVSMERPLSVHLGPGLLGRIYDGIQRPLREIKKTSGGYITPGIKIAPLDMSLRWRFTPGIPVGAPVGPGTVLGTVQETQTVLLKVLVPPATKPSTIAWIAPEGDYTISRARGSPGRRDRMCHGPLVARAPRTTVPGEARHGRAARHRPARDRRVLPDFPGRHGGHPRGLRHRQDHDPARAREVVRRGHHRLYRVRRARQRDDGRADLIPQS